MASHKEIIYKIMEKPQSWSPDYQLPDQTADQEEDVYQHLMECLFHMSDDEAERIKHQFVTKYSFIDKNRIKSF
jgi:hypothetical protein